MRPHPFLIVSGACCLFASGYLIAQEARPQEDPISVASKITTIGHGPDEASEITEQAAKRIKDTPDKAKQEEIQAAAARDVEVYIHARHNADADLFRRAVADTRVPPELAVEALYAYTSKLRTATSASQATQLSGEMALRLQGVQIAQNARIIELLEKIANEKK